MRNSEIWRLQLWRSHFPYALMAYPAVDGEICWIVVNREYKPIGFEIDNKFYVYDLYNIGIRPLKRYRRAWQQLFAAMSDGGHRGRDHRWFYLDHTNPSATTAKERRYFELLGKFAKIPVEFVKLKQGKAYRQPLRLLKGNQEP
jgi:hypothetical protein